MNKEKIYTWYKLANNINELQFPESGLTEIEMGGKKICISLHKEQLFASAAKCPHAGGKMSEGYIDALGNIVCPVHRYKYCLQNGRNSSGEGYFLKTYPIEKRDDGVYIGIEEGGILNWIK